jgi:hypothetical protein
MPFTLVTTCCKRWHFLQRSLPTWVRMPGLSRIVVVTYGFDGTPRDWLPADVELVTLQGPEFIRTQARNAGAFGSADSRLLFVDCDVCVVDAARFMAWSASADYVLDSPHALSRQGTRDPERTAPGLRGTHFVTRELFERVQGYNPHMRGWGVEDIDLYRRYAKQSDAVAYYDRSSLRHQPHGDALRRELQLCSLRQSVQSNKAKARTCKPWLLADPASRGC